MTPPTKKWIYLFGSNARVLYAIDALNTLALPRGWKLHYRYERKHVDNDLWESLVSAGNNQSALRRTPLVLNFVNQKQERSSEGKVSYRPSESFPLRTGLLTEHWIDGSVAHFWFTVLGYLRYEQSGKPGTLEWIQWQVQSRVQDACRGKTPFEGKYATWGSAEPFHDGDIVDDNEATSAFQSTVQAISGHGFNGEATIFARFHDLTNRVQSGLFTLFCNVLGSLLRLPSQPVEADRTVPVSYDRLTHKAKYILEENKVYQIGITIYNDKPLSLPTFVDAALELDFDPSVFIALDQKRIAISGRVDQQSFVVTTRKVTDDQLSFLRISPNPGVTKKEASTKDSNIDLSLLNDFRSPDWTIPVEVRRNRKARLWRIIQRVLAEGLVGVCTVAAASIFSRYIPGDSTKSLEPWVQRTIIILLILVLIGIGWKIKLDETK